MSDVPITLVYIRDEAQPLPALDDTLRVIVDRYAPLVQLQRVTPTGTPPELLRFAQRTPVVLVLRRGALVGEAIGATLPARELDRVVRCAVEWP